MARRIAVVSTSNGSVSPPSVFGVEAGVDPGFFAGEDAGPAAAAVPALAAGAVGFAAGPGLAGAAGFGFAADGFPDIEAPQNGHS